MGLRFKKNKMISFKLADTKKTEGIPAVEVLDADGRRLGMIYVEGGEREIGLMSDRLDGPFTESVRFSHEAGRHPVVVVKFAARKAG